MVHGNIQQRGSHSSFVQKPCQTQFFTHTVHIHVWRGGRENENHAFISKMIHVDMSKAINHNILFF